jgi:hypothetical protein
MSLHRAIGAALLALVRTIQWSSSRALDRFMMGVRGPPRRARRYPHGPFAVRIPVDRRW